VFQSFISPPSTVKIFTVAGCDRSRREVVKSGGSWNVAIMTRCEIIIGMLLA
jgi:hypothetical protein